MGTLSMIEGMRQQLLGELTGRRLVRSLGEASSASRDAGLVRCVLVRIMNVKYYSTAVSQAEITIHQLAGCRLVRSLGEASAASRDAGLVRCVW